MKKAFSLSFFVIGLIALASIVITNSPSNRGRMANSAMEEGSEPDVQALKGHTEKPSRPQTPPSSKVVQGETDKGEELSQKFLNPELPLEERLDAWTDLQRQDPFPTQSLIRIALAPNPFEGKKIKAHTVDEKNYQREESFRIMALQSLERAVLKSVASIALIENVANNASSPVVRRIAEKMYTFARNGQSYSNLADQAIMEIEVPE